MKTTIHSAESRGHANHGWLDSHHTFSFARYHNPDRMHFGALRVLNDDVVAPGQGFGTHPHENMEIISIPLEGDLEHKDSMGNVTIIKEGDLQVMSAGTGITHSEYNKNTDREVKFLQIWLFPNKSDVEPRYDQITLDKESLQNQLVQVLSPDPEDDGVWIYQNAWFHMGRFEPGREVSYTLNDPDNGAYVFVIEGDAIINGIQMGKRDGLCIEQSGVITITALTQLYLLLMEIPLSI